MLGVFIYFNYFSNIPHLKQVPLFSLTVNVLIQIFLLIVHSTAVILVQTLRSLMHAVPAIISLPPPWILKSPQPRPGPQSPNLAP